MKVFKFLLLAAFFLSRLSTAQPNIHLSIKKANVSQGISYSFSSKFFFPYLFKYQVDENMVKQGPYTIWHINKDKDSVKIGEGQYKDGMLYDTCIWYASNTGKVYAKGYFPAQKNTTSFFAMKYSAHKVVERGNPEGYLWLYYNTPGSKSIPHQAIPYHNDSLHGVYKTWSSKGSLESEYTYENGVKNGPYKEYHSNGKVSREGTLNTTKANESAKEVGWQTYYDTEGILSMKNLVESNKYYREMWDTKTRTIIEKTYATNHMEDSTIAFYPNGHKKNELKYDAQGNGFRIFYHENGRLERKTLFKNRREDGLSISYHPNGVKQAQHFYKDGSVQGMAYFWDEQGVLIKEIDYKDYNPRLERQYQKGKLILEEHYNTNYSLHGLRKEFYANGKAKSTATYNDGKLVSIKCFNEKGSPKPCTEEDSKEREEFFSVEPSEGLPSGTADERRKPKNELEFALGDHSFDYSRQLTVNPEFKKDSLINALQLFLDSKEGKVLRKIKDTIRLELRTDTLQKGKGYDKNLNYFKISKIKINSPMSQKQQLALQTFFVNRKLLYDPKKIEPVLALSYDLVIFIPKTK